MAKYMYKFITIIDELRGIHFLTNVFQKNTLSFMFFSLVLFRNFILILHELIRKM